MWGVPFAITFYFILLFYPILFCSFVSHLLHTEVPRPGSLDRICGTAVTQATAVTPPDPEFSKLRGNSLAIYILD